MINDRVVLVGIAWTLVLIGLLVAREFLRAMDGPAWKPAIRVMNILVVVMLIAAGLAGALRLTVLATPPTGSVVATPSPRPAPPRASIPPDPNSSPRASPGETPSGTLAPTPTPIATPAPSATPTPDATPTPSVSPTPTVSPTPAAGASGGRVTAGPTFRVYDLGSGGQVTGFRTVRAAHRFTADATSAEVHPFPSLSDPDGTVRLVRLLSGPFAGAYLGPNDRGVTFRPAGS